MLSPSDAAPAAPRLSEEEFAEQVLGLVESIPAGRVMTYGGIAAALGSRASRRVGKVMAHYGSEVPWWRVVHADGRPPTCHDAAALQHYRSEGTPVRAGRSGHRLDMPRALWSPTAAD